SICSRYGMCGPYGSCNMNNSPACSCMEGFEPQNPDKWSAAEWSSGCRRRTPLNCSNGDGFRVFKSVNIPDTRHSWSGNGCLMWFGELMDVRKLDDSQDLYVRMAKSDLKEFTFKSSSNKRKRIIIAAVSISSYEPMNTKDEEYSMEIQRDDTELSYFSLTMILKSTNDFSDDNKLGEGGFGPVYMVTT
nr:G-type lectin S-receptor-like serine/threonine-protein kinase At4g27290 [Tanacetum cinerariifolium]